MKNYKMLICCALAFFDYTSGIGAYAQDYSFKLKNSLAFDRVAETVEVEVPTITDFSGLALFDEAGNNLPYQYETGKITFQANIKSGSVQEFYFKSGTPVTPETKTYAVLKRPSTRNDIAWENDISVYRMYSAILLPSEPNTANGVDIWYKKKSYPVIDKMYSYSNYHSEQEEGVDAHSVNGKTLGGGGNAVYYNGKLWIHNPFNKCEIIESTPLRSQFILTYDNVEVDGDYYTKTVQITTSANSLLNKAVVKYEGTDKPMKLAAAIYMHTNMGYTTNGVTYSSESNIIGLAEDKSEGTVTSPNARMYAGIYMPGETTVEEIDHNLVIMQDYKPGTEMVYYFGGGWNIFPQGKYIADDDWFYELNKFKESVLHPIVETSIDNLPQKDDVINLIYKTNNYWQDTNPIHGNSFWNRAAYHTGNMEAYLVTNEKGFYDYSYNWSAQNEWKGAKSDNKNNWKYTYGETDDYVLFGDWQICFQVYADLYNLDPEEYKVARALEVMEYQMSTPANDYWWWADGLYMVMPVMTKLYKITGNELYLYKLYEYWEYANSIMYDEEEGLYYRDAKYVYPAHVTSNNKKDFWARGDGWVFAGLAKVLNDLPLDFEHRQKFLDRYLTMAKSISECQMPEGYWSRSLLDPEYASGYETSGTAFFTYGYLWGINNGYLSEKEYGKTVEKAWDYLSNIAVQTSGKVGYVQPIGENAAQHNVSAETTADFGVGAFLLAAAEMSKFAVGDMPKQVVRLYSAELEDAKTLKLVFNKTLNRETANDLSNYLIDGNSVSGDLKFDGESSVVIELAKNLDYGRYTISVNNLKSIDDELLENNCSKFIIFTVPIYPFDANYSVTAIGAQSTNPVINSIDNNLNTRWSQEGKNQWIMIDLSEEKNVWGVDVAFYSGDQRVSYFDVEYSNDNTKFEKVLSGMESSGKTNDLERYKFSPVKARYIRLMCNGNSVNEWNSITEVRVCVEKDDPFADIVLPEYINSDFLLPAGAIWSTSDKDLISASGYVSSVTNETTVILTATIDDKTKDYVVKLTPRDPGKKNIVVKYNFNKDDIYTVDGVKYLKDKSGKGNDAAILGNAKIEAGLLDLTANTASGFSSNGYLKVNSGLLDSLRSYTVLVTVNPSSLSSMPRIYDFGSASSNSVFARVDGPNMGFKYNAGATTIISSSKSIETGLFSKLAFTFDAKTKSSKIYIDGLLTHESNDIKYEPYQLTNVAQDNRNYIGRTQWWDSNVASSNVDYRGTMKDFYLFDIALNSDEINDMIQKENSLNVLDNVRYSFYLSGNIKSINEDVIVNAISFGDGTQIEVVDTKGALVKRFKADTFPFNIVQFKQSGVYFVNIKSDNNISFLNVMIK